MRGTLERLDKTLGSQADAFRYMAEELQNLKTGVAILKEKR
jgi:hypothetical protein